MATQRTHLKFTYEDYKHTPDDERYELIDGALIIMAPSPREAHQRTDMQLGTKLNTFVVDNDLGRVYSAPFDVVLSDTDVVQPDLMFISNERAHIITEDNIRGAPDIVIEILSPSTAGRDRTVKRALYAKHGAKEYWQVDTDAKAIAVLLLGADGYELAGIYGKGQTLTSPTLPGFALDLADVF